jgi:hypothetical protein
MLHAADLRQLHAADLRAVTAVGRAFGDCAKQTMYPFVRIAAMAAQRGSLTQLVTTSHLLTSTGAV